ncbi:MAG: hypothetical protein ABSF96_01770 [Steroidobacteraceae bacterium]
MTDDATLDAAHAAFIEVQIRPADGRGGDAQQYVGTLAHLCIGDLAHEDAAGFFEHHGFHGQRLG